MARGVAMRLGLRQIQGLGEEAGRRVEAARAERPFADLPDLARRAGLDRGELLALARADALFGFGLSRRQAAWAIEGLRTRDTPLLAGLGTQDLDAPLPVATPYEELQQDYLATGLSLSKHPVQLSRGELDPKGVMRVSDLSHYDAGDRVRVAGIVVNRQRPGTAKGVMFMTLEDETGNANLVIWPKLYEQQRRLIRHEKLLIVTGRLQREGEATSILAQRFEALRVGDIQAKSRDFR